MRITGWHVDAFGSLRDAGARDLPGGLVVVHGPNASGKSTLLAFLQRTLFGHPHRNKRDVNHYEPAGGGRRGGLVRCEADGSVVVERYAGRGGDLRVVLADGTVGGEAELAELTGGCDAELFNAVFAFDLDDLGSMDSLADDAVRDRLFSAGVRGAGRSARAVRDRLEDEAAKLWTPRSRKAAIDEIGERLAQTEDALARARQVAADYPERLAAERACEERVDRLTGEVETAEAAERRADMLLRAWPVWVRRQEAARERDDVADAPDLPDDASERFEAVTTRLSAATERWEQLDEEHGAVAEERDGIACDDALAGVAGDAVALDEERAAQRERTERLDALAAERQRVDSALSSALGDLGDGWDRERLQRLDASVAVRGEVRAWQGRLDGAERAVAEAEGRAADAQAEADRARQRWERAEEAVAEASGSQPPPERAEIERRREQLTLLRARLHDRGEARAEVAAAERHGAPGASGPRARWAPRAAAGVAAAALAGCAVALALGALTLAVALGAVAVVSGVVVVAARPGAGGSGGDSIGAARARLRAAADAVAEPARALGLPQDPSADDVERAGAGIDRADGHRAEVDRLRRQADEAARERDDAARDAERAAEAREAAARRRAEALAEWGAWCAERGLESGLDPGTVGDLIGAADRARDQLDQLARIDGELATLTSMVADYAERAGVALAAAGRDPVASPKGADRQSWERQLDAVRSLAEDVRADASRRERRRALDERLRDIERERDEQQRRLDDLAAQQRKLLDAAGAADEEEFRTAVKQAQRKAEVDEQLRRADADLRAQLGAGAEAEELRAELSSGDVAAWEAAHEQARRRRQELRGERDAAMEELYAARRAREEVERSDDIAELDGQRQALLSRRDELVHQWRVSTLACALVTRTLEGFERERQPEVLRRAGAHFATVTDGAYQGLLQQGEDLLARDADDRPWPVEQLSRGTAEQLYLCLRLALAEDLAARQARLPFVMDDVLVNFDPERARQVARLLARVAEDGQVLYFTCHPQTVELLEEAGAAGVYDLPRGGGSLVPRGGGHRADEPAANRLW